MHGQYRVNAPMVVSELIDGEVVIMNLNSGNYYSVNKCGAAMWEWMEQGYSIEQLVELVRQHYSGDDNEIHDAVVQFVRELADHELVKPTEPEEAGLPSPKLLDGTSDLRGTFERPQIEIYSDMQDLLLLDPIHDVDEVGWPTAKPELQEHE